MNITTIQINLEDDQLRELICVSTNMLNFTNLEEISSFRPEVSILENPRAWWKYIINAIILQKKTIRKSLSWNQLKARINDKSIYIELWKRKLHTLPSVWTAVCTAASAKRKEMKKQIKARRRNSKIKKSIEEIEELDVNIIKNKYKKSDIYLRILDEIQQIKNDIKNQTAAFTLLQRNKKIRPARYRSAKDTEISNSGKFSSPIRFDEKGNYISENNINYDINYDNDYYRDQNKNQNDYYDKNNEKETIDIPCALLLREIENNSTFDEIIYFRTLAERELSDTDNGQQSWLKSWFSW